MTVSAARLAAKQPLEVAMPSAAPSMSPREAPIASVRVDRGAAVLAAYGSADLLQQLVAYLGSLVALLSRDLGLDPFHALCAELSGLRVIVFRDGAEFVGLLFEPNSEVRRLRQRLGAR